MTEALKAEAKKAAESAVTDLLGDALGDKSTLKSLFPKSDYRRRIAHARNIMDNNGYVDSVAADLRMKDERFSYEEFVNMIDEADMTERTRLAEAGGRDAQSFSDVPMLMSHIVSQVVREAVEPVMALIPLFNEIRYSGASITFPSVGGMAAYDIGPGQRYPAEELDYGGTITATIGKSGLQIRFTDEVIRYSIFDIVGLHLRAAGRALKRLKELKAANQMTTYATAAFDNTGGTSLHGYTSGRDINASGNNTITEDDIFVMYADLINRGFLPNAFAVNPFGWLVFARHSTLRAWAFHNGSAMYQTAQGEPGYVGQRGVNLGPSNASGSTYRAINQTSTYGEHATQIFPAQMRMIVTPYVSYNTTTDVTDIYMLDTNELGVLVTDEPPTTEKWDDPSRDLQSIKIRERYGLALNNEGDGILVAKNVSTAKGFDFEAMATFPVGTGFLSSIP